MFSCYNHHRGCRLRADTYNSYCSACIALHLTENPRQHASSTALPTSPSPAGSHAAINSAFAAPISSSSSRRSSLGLPNPVSPLDLQNAHFVPRERHHHHSSPRYESPSAPPCTPHTSTFAPRPASLLISSSSTSSPESYSPITPTATNPFPHGQTHIHHSTTPYSSPTCATYSQNLPHQHQHQHNRHPQHSQPYPGRGYSPLTSSFASLAGRRSLDSSRLSSMGGHDDDGLALLLSLHRQRSEDERTQEARGRTMYWA